MLLKLLILLESSSIKMRPMNSNKHTNLQLNCMQIFFTQYQIMIEKTVNFAVNIIQLISQKSSFLVAKIVHIKY